MKKRIAWILCLALLAVTTAVCAETNIFETLAGPEWSFSSGAGAWSTDLRIQSDGTFAGETHDSDMGDCTDNYPDGTVYYCSFSGRMSLVEQVDENTWRIRVDELWTDPAEEEISDGIRYVPSEAYGLSEGDVMILYGPGTSVSVLSEEMQLWAHIQDQEEQQTELENWFLSSEANDSGFVGYQPVLPGDP